MRSVNLPGVYINVYIKVRWTHRQHQSSKPLLVLVSTALPSSHKSHLGAANATMWWRTSQGSIGNNAADKYDIAPRLVPSLQNLNQNSLAHSQHELLLNSHETHWIRQVLLQCFQMISNHTSDPPSASPMCLAGPRSSTRGTYKCLHTYIWKKSDKHRVVWKRKWLPTA